MTTPVPRTGFSTNGMSTVDGWNAWRNVFAPLFDIRSEDEPRAFRAEVDAFDLQTMILTRMTFGGIRQQGVRSKERIRHGGLDHYGIEFCLHSDGYTLESRNGNTAVRAGDIVVVDLGQAHTMTATNSDSISLTLPRSVLDAHCPGIERLHGHRIPATGHGQLLGDHMLSLYRHLPHMAANETNALADATAALVAACLAPTPERLDQAGGAIDQTMFDRARRYVSARLEDPHLSPADICAAIGSSRSNLYRLFQPLGGIARYIRDCRLQCIHAALRNPAEPRSISELAYAHGFVSAAHFSRAFRARFGCSPGEIRNLAGTGIPATPEPATPENFVATWLKKL